MIKTGRRTDNSLPRTCILEEGKLCDNCCECFVCDLDPDKMCDNCAKCLRAAEYSGMGYPLEAGGEDVVIEAGRPQAGRTAGHRGAGRKPVKPRLVRSSFRLVRTR